MPDAQDSGHSLGDRAASGSLFLIGATGAAKAVGFACQLALAWLLTRQDYGTYAIAISLAVFLSALRDGGLQFVLEQKRKELDRFEGPVFWMMLAINALTGLLIALVARPAARLYGIPDLVGVISLFALSIPLTVLPTVLTVRLAVDLRFRELGMLQVISGLVRNALLVLFAALGFGPRSFIMPLLLASIGDSLLLRHFTHASPWRSPPRFELWPELFQSGRWVVLGTFAIAFGYNGAYFLLGRYLPGELVGTYFFAFQLVVQLGVLLADNVTQVLTPGFVRMVDEPSRLRGSVLRALRLVVVVSALASLSIAAIYGPLERALWHGKWAGAGPALCVFAVVWPAAATASVLRSLQMSTGHFRQWGSLTLLAALVSVSGAVAGASLGHGVTAAAIGYAAGLLTVTASSAAVALPRIGIPPGAAGAEVLRPWVILLLAAAPMLAVPDLALSPWLEVLVRAASFGTLSYVGLRLLDRNSFELVRSALLRVFRNVPRPA